MKMQTATILPTYYLNLIEDRNYHMALAHLIGKDEKYTQFYTRQAVRGAYVILDNSIIEGAQQSIEDICKKADLIGAREIILPDVFKDSDATIEKSYEALCYVKENFPHLKVMAVPQGKDAGDWLECAQLMIQWDVDCIGIPKVLTSLCGRDARLHALMDLKDMFDITGKEIHLLGCWETPIECTMIAKAMQQGDIPEVRGVDSAIAYVYARDNTLICNGPRPSGAVDFGAKDAGVLSLAANIQIWEGSVDLSQKKITNLFR